MLRIITLNIWQEQGPWEKRIPLIANRLRELQPDIVCLQEVRQVPNQIPNQAETLATSLNMQMVFEIVQPWGKGDEGLAILSRFPIVKKDKRELPFEQGQSRRICLGAKIEGAFGKVWAFSTHLAFRLQDGAIRERQVLEIDKFVRSVSDSEVFFLCGDFNSIPDSDEMRYLRGLKSIEDKRTYYQDAFAVCNPGVDGLDGFTWHRGNPYTKYLEWLALDRRLDYIYVSPQRKDGAGKILSCRIVCTEPDENGILCSDHYGVMAEVATSS